LGGRTHTLHQPDPDEDGAGRVDGRVGLHQHGGAIVIAYSTSRRVCVYLGPDRGNREPLGEAAELEEQTCMLRGDSACLFRVQLTPMAG
jgi:hypothetical protein